MAEAPHRPPRPPHTQPQPTSLSAHSSITMSSTASPLPTPPSSITTIPPLCFPSPTSVADLADHSPHVSTSSTSSVAGTAVSTSLPPTSHPANPNARPASLVVSASPHSAKKDALRRQMRHVRAQTCAAAVASSQKRAKAPDLQPPQQKQQTRQLEHVEHGMIPSENQQGEEIHKETEEEDGQRERDDKEEELEEELEQEQEEEQEEDRHVEEIQGKQGEIESQPHPGDRYGDDNNETPLGRHNTENPENTDENVDNVENDNDMEDVEDASDEQHADLERLFSARRREMANVSPTVALDDVTKAQFLIALQTYTSHDPPNADVSWGILATRTRLLLDHLDALVEQLSLRTTNDLFDALASPRCLTILLFLLSDVSARCTPVIKDVRKTYRYPYLVTNILANGNSGIRDAFLSSPRLINHLLSFLDGDVHLSCHSQPAITPCCARPTLARDNPIIVGNVVQILVSYIETSTEPLLDIFQTRPSFVPAVVNLLEIGSVPNLLMAIIPDRCVDDVATMDHCKVAFDLSLTAALTVLSASTIFHHLADAFVRAAQTIFSLVPSSRSNINNTIINNYDTTTTIITNVAKDDDFSSSANELDEDAQATQHRAQQLAYNVIQVYSTIVKKAIRAVRINTGMPACQYLNIYSTAGTAGTISQILRVGTELFRETKGVECSILDLALLLVIQVLQYVEEDRERRVACVMGQPPPLDTTALEEELGGVMRMLMSVLIDTATSGTHHASIRLRILEVVVECTRVCSEDMMGFIDKLRFGEIAFKVMLSNPRNSLMHNVVCRGVESALISPSASKVSAYHWLVRSKLVQKIMRTWAKELGDERWCSPAEAQKSPFLSALIQMASCVQHYQAVFAERSGKGDTRDFPELREEVRSKFEKFCSQTLGPILAQETTLCGPKPRRKLTRSTGGLGRSFGVLARGSKRSGSGDAHLVRSPSAHRFGYVPPVSSLRSRFDEVFIEGEEEDFEAGVGCSSLAGVFDVPDVSDALG